MQGDSFYIGFSALVQLATVFSFGLLYLYKNHRSIFRSVQITFFDAFRKNSLILWLLRYPASVTKPIKPSTHGPFFCTYKARIRFCENGMKAALDFERTCDYLAVTGIVSGIYSVGWLLLVPVSFKYGENAQDIYMTLTMSAFVAECLMLMYAIYQHMTRAKSFLFSIFILLVCCTTALVMYRNGIRFPSLMDFDTFFLFSMLIVYAPIGFFVAHNILFTVLRIIIMAVILVMTLALQLILLLRRSVNY